MKRFYKKDKNNFITEVICEYQKDRLDGNEIPLDEVIVPNHKINGKSISNNYGAYIFYVNGQDILERSQNEIDNDLKTLSGIKQEKMNQLSNINDPILLKDMFRFVKDGVTVPQNTTDKITLIETLQNEVK